MNKTACRTNGVPSSGQVGRLGSWFMPQNFLFPQRDQPLLLPVDMREWLPEDDLACIVLDAVAALDLGEFRRRYRADGHGRAAFDPEMMMALPLYAYCQGERSSRVIEKRCVRRCGLPAERGRAAARSRHHRPVPGSAREGAGRVVQPGAGAGRAPRRWPFVPRSRASPLAAPPGRRNARRSLPWSRRVPAPGPRPGRRPGRRRRGPAGPPRSTCYGASG
jgi:hypothetical protein